MVTTEKNRCQLKIHARELGPAADEQVHLIASHPALQGLIAIMPDAHTGAGCVSALPAGSAMRSSPILSVLISAAVLPTIR